MIEEGSTYNAVAMVSVSHLGTKVLIARELVELARCVRVAAGGRVLWPLRSGCCALASIRILSLQELSCYWNLAYHGSGTCAVPGTQMMDGTIRGTKLSPLVCGHQSRSCECRNES